MLPRVIYFIILPSVSDLIPDRSEPGVNQKVPRACYKTFMENIMRLAASLARAYRGATAPNPVVGAVCLDEAGEVLSYGAHQKAGGPHAEIHAIEMAKQAGVLEKIHTLVLTLEPCCHTGNTPPCTDAILATGLKRIVIGSLDPNPKVSGRSVALLKSKGLEILIGTLNPECQRECDDLIAPFTKWITTGLPFVTLKIALKYDFDLGQSGLLDQAMRNDPGQKTFTSPEARRFVHELRKQSDAIVTGSGTVLADRPLFTVRHTVDHPGKNRHLVIMDRRKRVPDSELLRFTSLGFQAIRAIDLFDAYRFLGTQGVLEVLVEAGPGLSRFAIESKAWDRLIKIVLNGKVGGAQTGPIDSITVIER